MAMTETRKCKTIKSSQIIISILLFCNFATKISEAGSCDKSRKIFNGVSYGIISHGLSNYTQVSKIIIDLRNQETSRVDQQMKTTQISIFKGFPLRVAY